MKKYIKILAADIAIAITAVFLYSPGLLCLRITDESIFRAGMSVLAGLGLLALFLYLHLRALRAPEPAHMEPDEARDPEKARALLKSYADSRFFGSIAGMAVEQLDRLMKCKSRLAGIIRRKFVEGTISWEKFNGIVGAAEASAVKNAASLYNRICIFDEDEYAKLSQYREDTIPDEIQKARMQLYQKNFDAAKEILALNEKILLKLDALAIELSSFESSANEEMNSGILDEIEKLIQDAKYYQ